MKKLLGCTMFPMFIWTGTQAQDFDLDDIIGEAQDFYGEVQGDAEKAANTEAKKSLRRLLKTNFKNITSMSPI